MTQAISPPAVMSPSCTRKDAEQHHADRRELLYRVDDLHTQIVVQADLLAQVGALTDQFLPGAAHAPLRPDHLDRLQPPDAFHQNAVLVLALRQVLADAARDGDLNDQSPETAAKNDHGGEQQTESAGLSRAITATKQQGEGQIDEGSQGR